MTSGLLSLEVSQANLRQIQPLDHLNKVDVSDDDGCPGHPTYALFNHAAFGIDSDGMLQLRLCIGSVAFTADGKHITIGQYQGLNNMLGLGLGLGQHV